MRVLIAEDDAVLGRILERGLRAHGFEVVAVDSAASAAGLAGDPEVGIVVVDTALRDFDGAATLGSLRGGLPVLLLTPREEDASRALSGELSADDYLVKPFAFEELIARIRARTRRVGERRVTMLRAGDLRIDLLARCAWRGERAIDLPTREFALLEYFMRHPSRVLSRADILTDVWGYNFASESNLVDVYVRYLRHRIDEPGQPSLLTSVRGHGYRFDASLSKGEV